MPPAGAPFPFAGEGFAALSALLWGSAHVVFARINPRLSASALNLGKNVFSCGYFLIALWAVSGSPIPTGLDAEAILVFSASGILGLSLCDTLLMRSLMDIGPQRMNLLFLSVPVLVALVSTVLPVAESQSPGAWMGMIVCIAGIAMAVQRRSTDRADPVRFRRGVLMGVTAALLQTGAILLARYGLAGRDAPILESAVVRMTAGTAGLVIIGLFRRQLGSWSREMWQPHAVWMLAGASLIGTFLGILTNQFGLKWSTYAGVATTLNSLMPIYLLPLSVIFLGERFSRREIAATFVAVAGVAWMFLAS